MTNTLVLRSINAMMMPFLLSICVTKLPSCADICARAFCMTRRRQAGYRVRMKENRTSGLPFVNGTGVAPACR